MRQIPRVSMGFLLACSLSAAQAAPAVQESGTLAGHPRSWLVHLPPAYMKGHPLPLVIAYHGRGGSAAGMEKLTGLDAVADRQGFIVVYPEGLHRSWAAELDTAADAAGVDDVAFTAALLDKLEQDYSIDTHRILLTGFSNGAHLVHLLGCKLADRISAIVPVSGTLADPAAKGCVPARSLTVVEFHGSADPIDPYAGGRVLHSTDTVASAPDGIAAWAARDKCRAPAVVTKLTPAVGDMGVSQEDFPGCAGGVTVRLYTIEGAGHVWPGGPQYLPEMFIGKATQAMDASAAIGQLAVGKGS